MIPSVFIVHCKLDKVRNIVPYHSREPLEDVINGLRINGQLEQVDRDWYRFSLPVSSKSEPQHVKRPHSQDLARANF